MARSFELLNWSNGPFNSFTRAILEVGAHQLAVTARASPQSDLSDKSRKWLTMLARIKFQIEEAALEASRYQSRDAGVP